MLIALMMGGNHVAARSMITALVVAVIVVSASLDPTFTVRQRWVLIARCVHGATDVLQCERLHCAQRRRRHFLWTLTRPIRSVGARLDRKILPVHFYAYIKCGFQQKAIRPNEDQAPSANA